MPHQLHATAKSLETAIEAADYPYGRLRTSMFYFVEENKRGWRPVRQSLNPKTNKINKPHAGNYSAHPIYVCEKDNGHLDFVWVPTSLIGMDQNGKRFNIAQAFVDTYWNQIPAEHKKIIKAGWALEKLHSPQYYNGVEITYPEE